MTAIIDYGVGNLFSLQSSLAAIGETAIITGDPEKILEANRVILPGVGAFGDAAKKLSDSGLDSVIKKCVENKTPLLGICLGMQLLFDESYEYGRHRGLGLIPGKVVAMEGSIPKNLKIPHIGCNYLKIKNETPLLSEIKNGDFVYFVHSYYVVCDETNIAATTDYGLEITATVFKDNVFGCQFHPEKSGDVGLKILRKFCSLER